MEVPTIYKAYSSGLCKWISPQNIEASKKIIGKDYHGPLEVADLVIHGQRIQPKLRRFGLLFFFKGWNYQLAPVSKENLQDFQPLKKR